MMDQAILGASSAQLLFWVCAGSLAAIALFFTSFALIRRARLLEDTPTSLIRSAAQGYVELNGYARLLPGPPIVSPLSDTPCAWWSYRVDERYRNGGKTEWRMVENETSGELFVIADATGECIVDPDDATVTPGLSRRWGGPAQRPHRPPDGSWFYFGDYRYSEKLILIGAPLYAIGWFRTQNAMQDFNESRDVGELLAEWKRDQRDLLRRFDANGDGQIDLQEWETVRRAAIGQVRAHQVEQSLNPDLHVLCKPPDRRPFLLSTVTQKILTRRMRFRGLLCLLASVTFGGLCLQALHLRGLL
jgi:hypothetical protein